MNTVEILRAGPADTTAVAGTIASAFQHLDVARWLVPDSDHRHDALLADMEIRVRHAIDHGAVHTTPGCGAVAVWLPSDAPGPVDHEARLRTACPRYADRFLVLDATLHTHTPTTSPPYRHLAMLAVLPALQNRGLGSALLHHQVETRPDEPVYLEASSARSRELYLAHGFHDAGGPFTIPGDIAPFWPMWRAPTTRPTT